ncbi:MAG: cobalamin biosynthesis protein [Colwellia sp.]|nr:cobalamin biosynthesis protein [Colwellia sp.]
MIDITTISFPPINHFSSTVLLLFVVILIKGLMTRLVNHQPLSFFNFYCKKLSEKVNKAKNPAKQQSIAGFIALVITLAPLIVILSLFEMFIEVPWLWQGCLLYLAIGPFNLATSSKSVAQALVANQNYLAKQTLQPLVLRETEQLSKMGLSKSCIEMQLLKTLQQNFVVIFYFLMFGPLFAFSYRLLLEMHYSWNIKQTAFSSFGQQASILVNLIQWLPVRLFTLLMLIMHSKQNLLLSWRLIKGKIFRLNNDIALHCLALNLQVRLGGVAIYHDEKLRKTSFNDQARQPEPTDIIHTSTQLKYTLIICAVMLIMISVFAFIIQNKL